MGLIKELFDVQMEIHDYSFNLAEAETRKEHLIKRIKEEGIKVGTYEDFYRLIELDGKLVAVSCVPAPEPEFEDNDGNS